MLPTSITKIYHTHKISLKMLYFSKIRYILRLNKCFKNYYVLQKQKTIKNENISFSKHIINIEMLHKQNKNLFYNVKKIPYGCVYDKLIYI